MKVSTETGGGGILVTTSYPSDHANHHSYAILAGTWCSSFLVGMKAIKKVLQIFQTEELPKKVQIVCDSQSVLLCITSLQPAMPFKSAEESDILSSLVALHDEGYQITFTRCPNHYWVVGNEMTNEQAQKANAAN